MSQERLRKKPPKKHKAAERSKLKTPSPKRRIKKNRAKRPSKDKIKSITLREKALKAEIQRFNDVLETLPVYLILLTPDYHIPYANRFFRERFGDAGKRHCYEYLFGRTEPCETCETYTTLKTMKPHRWEWLGPDNRWYDIYDLPFTDSDGSTMIMEMGVDITEPKTSLTEILQHHESLTRMVSEQTAEVKRKDMQLANNAAALAKVKEDANNLELFPQENPYPVMRLSFDGIPLYANPASAELLEDWKASVGSRAPANIQRILEDALTNDTPKKIEIRCRAKYYLLTFVPIIERGYVNVYGHDISEQKDTEEALLISMEKYRELVSNANSIIIRMDRNGTITYFNEYAQKFFGYTSDEIIGKDVKILVPVTETNGKDLYNMVDNVLRSPDEFGENINENIRKNGERVWISWRNKAIKDRDDNIIGNLAIGSDVTERMLAEDALVESESILHAFFDSAGAMRGVVEVIAEDDVRHITDNSVSAAFFGTTPEAMKNKTSSELGQPSNIRLIWIRHYLKSQQTGKPVAFEYIDPRMGRKYWLQATVSYMGIGPSGFPRFTYMFTDISERKRSDDELREVRDYLDSLIEFANAPIIVWEPSRKITRFNRAFEYMTGYRSDEVVGRDLEILFPESSRRDSLARIANTLSGEYWQSVEIPIQRSDGEIRIALWNSANIYSADKAAIVATIAQGQDITNLKQTQEALYRSEAHFRLLSETAERLIMWKDIQPIVKDLCQKTMRHLGCDVFFNYLVDEKAGQLHLNAFAGISDEDSEKIRWLEFGSAICGSVARDAEPIVVENILTTPDIRTDLVRSYGVQAYACHPLMVQDRLIGTLSFGTRTRTSFSQEDLVLMKRVTAQVASAMERAMLINEIQRSRDELETRVQERTATLQKINEALRQSNLALADFAHVASHDLQEPLRKIMTFSERLESLEFGPLSDQAHDYLARMQQAAARMQLLIQDLAKYSRVTSNQDQVRFMNLREPLNDAVRDLSVLIEEMGAQIEIGELPDIEANPTQISQLFANLIVSFDGKAIGDANDLPMIVAATPVGKTVRVEIMRNGEGKTLNVKVGELKEEAETKPEQTGAGRGENRSNELGFAVGDITPQMAEEYNLTQKSGVIILQVDSGSPAEDAGLAAGDIVAEIDREKISDSDQFNKKIKNYKAGDTILFLIRREGTSLFLTLNVRK